MTNAEGAVVLAGADYCVTPVTRTSNNPGPYAGTERQRRCDVKYAKCNDKTSYIHDTSIQHLMPGADAAGHGQTTLLLAGTVKPSDLPRKARSLETYAFEQRAAS
jgi:hypothetical protein